MAFTGTLLVYMRTSVGLVKFWGELSVLCSGCAVCLSPCCGQDAPQSTSSALRSSERDAAGCDPAMLMYPDAEACIADTSCNISGIELSKGDTTVLLARRGSIRS